MRLIPDWVYWIALGVLGALCLTQTARLSSTKMQLAEVRQERSDDEAARQKAAREHEAQLSKMEHDHAVALQEKDNVFQHEKAAWEKQRAVDAAAARSLRNKLATATARDRAFDPTDPVACERQADRHEALGGMAGEGVELLAEGRSLLQQRDGEVKLLLGIIAADRAACSAQSAKTNSS